MKPVMDNIAAAVTYFRKSRGWSMGQLAKYSDLSSEYISQLEAGKRGSKIRQVTLTKLARGLRITEQDLINFDPNSPPRANIKVIREPAEVHHGELRSSDRQLRIIKSLGQLTEAQLVKLESFLDFLIERGE